MQTEKLKDLLTKITQGEWKIDGDLHISSTDWHITNVNPYAPETSNSQANAEIISLSPQLAKRVIELEEGLKEILEDYDQFNSPTHNRITEKAKQLLNQ